MSRNLLARVIVYRKNWPLKLRFLRIVFIALCTLFYSGCGNLGQGFTPTSTSATNIKPNHVSLIVINGSFAPAIKGKPYNTVLSVSGGSAPYTFSLERGNLPPGLSLSASTGSVSGVPVQTGNFSFAVRAADHLHLRFGAKLFNIVVEPPAGASPSVIITSGAGTVPSGGKLQFTATVRNISNPTVTWSASAGTLSSNGLFTAPSVTTMKWVVVTATSRMNPRIDGSATISVTPASVLHTLVIVNSALIGARTGVPYSASVMAQGGTPPYTWALSGGLLPRGLSLNSKTGLISGLALQTGSANFAVKVTDAASHAATQPFTIDVSRANSGNYDGPAELPRVYVPSAMANTPAPGGVVSVNAGGDLQSALNNANCGDTIQLQAGAIFSGQFTFPAKSCDDAHWIIVRTSAPDSALPPEGTRLTPCFAGISSLPSRPSFHCASTINVMAKIAAASQLVPIVFAPGANHYRLVGLEITRPPGGGPVGTLTTVQIGGTVDHIVYDRVWMHGTPQDETKRGIYLGGSSYVAVVDSFFTDFHCTASTGTCTDAQSILGGLGDLPMGPYKIVNNFLEASGENILFGGGPASQTPADIEIRQNHMFKPRIWQRGQPGYTGGAGGGPFIVKNLFELKNAQRVLFEANVLEYSWGGFTQDGFGILLTPKNQNGLCPVCQVTDITLRYSTISHVGAGLSIANALADNISPPLAGERYSIHDLVVDDIDGTAYDGVGLFAKVSTGGGGTPIMRDVVINHVTAFPPQFLLWVGGFSSPMINISFTNNIESAGLFNVKTTGGGSANCAFSNVPIGIFASCFKPGRFTNNAVIGASNAPPNLWPSGNFFPNNAAAVQFVNYNNGAGGDYHLLPGSPYKNAGLDGKDLGADVDAVNAAVAGVY